MSRDICGRGILRNTLGWVFEGLLDEDPEDQPVVIELPEP